ncbi:MAG: hypothetical protein ABEI31_09165 [Halodesulfurarchaeum sp.]
MTDPDALGARPGLLARAAAVGLVAGAGGTVVLVLLGRSMLDASTLVFALAALVGGFGLTSWATTLWLGDVVEAVLREAEGDTGWTKGGANVAFSLLTALGGGGMVGVAVATAVLSTLGIG